MFLFYFNFIVFHSKFTDNQGSHVANNPGFYILQWKWSPGQSKDKEPLQAQVQEVFDQVTNSKTAKAKLIYYTDLLPSTDFRYRQ